MWRFPCLGRAALSLRVARALAPLRITTNDRQREVSAGCAAWITNETYSYSARGELTDVYESTPHSGGYYHTSATYWANGALNTLNMNLTGVPSWTFGVDGEGRPSTVTASSGTSPLVSSTAYNLTSSPPNLQVTLGSGDSDTFSFDANTGRMTQYKYTVGATPQSVVGNLGWNSNGSLSTLGITDPFNGANQQTCSYSHDDLARITTANCGTAANQTFTYDPFGNIDKSGSPYSFQPGYTTNPPTNRISSLPGCTPSYDANGNLTNDCLNTYAWDAEGRPVTTGPVTNTYDALGRMVEQAWINGQNQQAYDQLVYDPLGRKLFFGNNQNLWWARVPLPGGGRAAYTVSNGTAYVAYYSHVDWLGSDRFFSTQNQTMYGDVAYAPFGESYAQSGTVIGSQLSFTGQNSDTVGGDYDFLMREYSFVGRWLSPDPAGLAAVDPSDPQSWNRYAYVRNSPTELTDPAGLCWPDESGCWSLMSGDDGDGWGGGIFINIGIVFGGGGGGGGGGRGSSPSGNSGLPPQQGGVGAPSGLGCLGGTPPILATGGGFNPCSFPLGGIDPRLIILNAESGNGSGFWDPWDFVYRVFVWAGPYLADAGNFILYLLDRPHQVSWVLPLAPAPGAYGIGPAGNAAFNPQTMTLCVGAGAGISQGHNVAYGPITNAYTLQGAKASPDQINSMISGWSISGGGNLTGLGVPGPGGQLSGNGSGWYFSPTVGVPGWSTASTYTSCVP